MDNKQFHLVGQSFFNVVIYIAVGLELRLHQRKKLDCRFQYQVVLRLPMSRNYQNDKSNFYSAYGMTSGNVVSHPALVKKKRNIYSGIEQPSEQ